MAYDVSIFTLVEVKFTGVDAVTPIQAIAQAKENVDFGVFFSHHGLDWGEDYACYLVDTSGKRYPQQSEWFLDADHVEFVQRMIHDGVHQA